MYFQLTLYRFAYITEGEEKKKKLPKVKNYERERREKRDKPGTKKMIRDRKLK